MLATKQNMGKGQDLLDAARKGDVEKLVALISKRSGPFPSLRRGAGVNVQDDKGFTPLHLACLQQHKEIVRLLLSVDASPCIVDKAGATPLHYAAFNGNPDIVAMLLAHTTPPENVNHQTINLETPLLMAAPFGHVEVVQQLMKAGADVTLKNVNNETALDLAAQFGRTEVVRLLLRACPKLIDPYRHPNSTKQVFSNTPLHRASINGHKSIVSLLIEAGVDPNVSTSEGTALHEAARFYRASVARALLQHGADVRARGRGGATVLDMLAGQPQEASRRVRNVIREFDTTEDETPCFPVSPTYPVAGTKAPDTQKNTNKIDSFLSPSSSSLTKKHPQSFVKKLAQKCLGFKSKFNSAPNICNTAGLESVGAIKYKHSDQKISTNTLHIGNSKFFQMLLKKEEESGEINCTDEFDTISLDRLGTLNRDNVVNRSNRSCPGFKTSLPDIYENTEISESHDSLADSVIVKSDCISEQTKNSKITEAVNCNTKLSIFEPREISAVDFKSNTSDVCANFINECYESCEMSSKNGSNINSEQNLSPKLSPRPLIIKNIGKDVLYENVNIKPIPATRTHVPSKNIQNNVEKNVLYENVVLQGELKPHPLKRTAFTSQSRSDNTSYKISTSSISSSASSDSMIDESNLEDILISERSKSFKHGQKITLFDDMNKSEVCRTQSNASIRSDISDVTQASALENVDCSEDISEQNMRLSMTGTLPNKKPERLVKKKVLFRHKTFTNIEVDRNSLPKWNGSITKETLANYHIRGTGHCIFKAPTVLEFINMFNNESLYKNVRTTSFSSNTKRDSYFETVICFCKSNPPKHHLSAEDLEVHKEEAKASIDIHALNNRLEIKSTSFSCYCDVGTCRFHSTKRASPGDLVVKFSAVKRSISTPDITLETSPSSTELKKNQLTRKQSVPYKLETPCTVSKVNEIVNKNNKDAFKDRSVSHPSTISSTSSRPYSIRDIADVISLNSTSSADPNLTCASEKQLPLRKTSSSEYSGQWSLQSCDSNVTIKSDASYKTCFEESSDDGSDGSEGTLQSDGESSDAETVTSDASSTKRPWVSSGSFRFEHKEYKFHNDVIVEEDNNGTLGEANSESYAKNESGISVGSESSSSACETDGGIPRVGSDVSLGIASLERDSGAVAGVRSGSGRRRWEEADGTSEGDALSVSSAASSCAAHHLGHHLEYSKVSPTPPKKPPRRNLSVSPTHANSPSSGYSYELRTHARSQDDLDDIQGPKIYLKHGRSVDQYVDGKLSYSEYEENHNSPRIIPVPNPRSSLKNRTQPVAITAMYENVVIREQNPRRKLKRNNFGPQHDNCDPRMNDNRVRKYSNQERSSLESLLDSQSMNSPSDCERYYEGHKVDVPSSPTHYEQPPTPDHPPPSAKQAENSIHERIRPLSQLIMEVVEEIRIRKKSQGDISGNS